MMMIAAKEVGFAALASDLSVVVQLELGNIINTELIKGLDTSSIKPVCAQSNQ
jgi:hypothetical protein